jgi:hypothetical protein
MLTACGVWNFVSDLDFVLGIKRRKPTDLVEVVGQVESVRPPDSSPIGSSVGTVSR